MGFIWLEAQGPRGAAPPGGLPVGACCPLVANAISAAAQHSRSLPILQAPLEL